MLIKNIHLQLRKGLNMGIIKIAVCDDEKIFACKMKKIIDIYFTKKQIPYEVDIYPSGKLFIESDIRMMEYQIVFLDINMKEIDGLETARRLRKVGSNTFIIFVTAFINYTLEGYKVDAIRYLLKTSDNFEQSVEESLNAVFQKMEYVPVIKKINFKECTINISLEKIIYIESTLHKLTFHVWDGGTIIKYTMYETLNNVSKMFTDDFMRIHQSYLVNLKFVKKLVGNDILLSNDKLLPIARSRLNEVRNRVAIYKGEM